VFCFFSGGDGGFAGDGRKGFEKVFEGLAAFEVIEECLEGDTRSAKDVGSAKDIGVFGEYVHEGTVARVNGRRAVGRRATKAGPSRRSG
jgi:hypothetical protein